MTQLFLKKKQTKISIFIFENISFCLFVNFNNYNNNLNTKRLANSIIIIYYLLSILFLIKKLELFIYKTLKNIIIIGLKILYILFFIHYLLYRSFESLLLLLLFICV